MNTTVIAQEDPYLWLEDVMGEKAISWVKEQNAKSQKLLEAEPQFAAIRDKTLEVVNSRARIPAVAKRGAFFYNFWQDEKNIRGIWRRTTLAEYTRFVKEVKAPILANLTEFGQTPYFTVDALKTIEISMIIYPLSAFRAMSRAAEAVYAGIRREGTQVNSVEHMQTRKELYEVLGYMNYEQKLDQLFGQVKP